MCVLRRHDGVFVGFRRRYVVSVHVRSILQGSGDWEHSHWTRLIFYNTILPNRFFNLILRCFSSSVMMLFALKALTSIQGQDKGQDTMPMLSVLILLGSLLLQLAAAGLAAIFLRRAGRHRSGWACFVLAMVFMVERRAYPLYQWLVNDDLSWTDLPMAITALVISALTLTGVMAMGRLLSDANRFEDRLNNYDAEIRRLAITDYLTGVFNRRHFLSASAAEFDRARRYQRVCSVIVMDVDHFRTINDDYGHVVGDEALRRLTRVCRETVRTCDVLGRIGGEEFALTVPETDQNGALELAERLRHRISKVELAVPDGVRFFTVSIGVAEVSPSDGRIEETLRRADLALSAAKHAGRNRVVAAS
ncbi:putative diguanylate cyclase DgcC [Azospirillaceae bacterium]